MNLSDLRGAEERLGVALPAALREGYARFGQRREIAESFDTLVRAVEAAIADIDDEGALARTDRSAG